MTVGKNTLFGCLILVAYGAITPAQACLTFCLKHDKEIVYGRNFDWSVGIGAVMINRRHVRKVAFTPPEKASLMWTSKYGSVTFNQFSKDVPVGGMNEKGLVIECLVSKATHPRIDRGKVITELQWIQYHLDTCKTVEDVIESAKTVRISKYAVSLHYFITDSTGKSAVVEFLNGTMVHRTGAALPKKVLANTIYDLDLGAAKRPVSGARPSRFSRADTLVSGYDGKKKPVPFAFDTLDAVAQGDFTKWQIVYDVGQRIIHFRTLDCRKIKTIDVSKLDFETIATPKILDVNFDGSGNVLGRFVDYSQTLNDELMTKSLSALKLAGLMQHVKPAHVDHIRGVIATYKYQKPEPEK